MPNEINIYTPRYLAEVVRIAPPIYTFFRDTFFTNVKTFSTERVDIDLVKGDRRMAAFVHPRAGGEPLSDRGYKTESYKPPLINPYDITTADQLMARLPGEDLYNGLTPAQRAAQKQTEEYMRLNDGVTRREEWMAAQAIVEGNIPIVGKGVNEVIDFGFTNKVTLTGDKKWGGSKSEIAQNLRDWKHRVSVNGFSNVDMAVMGWDALNAFLNDLDIRSRLDTKNYGYGAINVRELPNGLTFYGHLNDPALDIYCYDEHFLDDWSDPSKPETKPLVPTNKVILINHAPSFMRAYGLCTYLDDKSGQWVTAQTDRLLRSYIEHHPDRRMLEVQSHPLPIPEKVDSWLVATVC
jgi:hypothetical protein